MGENDAAINGFHILIGAIVVGIAVGIIVFFLPNNEQNAQQVGIDPNLRTLAAGAFGGFEMRKNYLITDQVQLEEVWNEVFSGNENAPALPEVDFENEYVFALFQGERPTTGYSIYIRSVDDTESNRVVHITIEEPSEDCMTAQAISTPFFIAAYPKSDLPIEKVEEVHETCANVY
jgi:hypothetical protein